MELHDYLRNQSAHYRQIVETSEDLLTDSELLELLELSATSKDLADDSEDHSTGG